MKKYFSSLFTLLLVATSVQAQIIGFSNDTVTTNGYSNDYEIVTNCNIDNLTNADQTIVWRRTINSLPNGWTTSVCDKNACWSYSTDTKTFLLPYNRSEKLDVHFYPNNNTGNALVEMIAYVQGDSANTVVRSVYKASAEQPSSVTTTKKNFVVNVYPNPVKDIMMIKGLPDNQTYKVEVYSILGMKISSQTLAAGSSQGGIHEVDVQELPKGVYMVRVVDKNMNLVFNKSISKNK
jgi:hypothetical protein